MIGEREVQEGIFTLKNMVDGSQKELSRIELLEFFNTSNTNQNALH